MEEIKGKPKGVDKEGVDNPGGPIDVSLSSSPVRNRPLVDRMDVPPSQETDISLGSSLPYGPEEFVQKTKGFQPRSRSAVSREMQFRSREERVAFFKKGMDAMSMGKTHIPEDLKERLAADGYYCKWLRKSIKEKYDGPNLRNCESQGWEYARAEVAPELAYVDWDGEIQDSVMYVEGGGLILGILDMKLREYELEKQKKKRDDQQRMRDVLTRMPDGTAYAQGSLHDQAHLYGNPGMQGMI